MAALAESSPLTGSPLRHPTLPYVAKHGTSMAAPFIAGVIALMLERELALTGRLLTPEEIKLRLRATAVRDRETGRVWNPGFGFGKVDVGALLSFPVAVPPGK